jgi:Domain of unknown function (DUF4386)
MNTNRTTSTTSTSPMSADRRAALAAGLFYIATFLFSIPALAFYGDAIDDPNWVLGVGNDSGVLWGGLFEVLTGLTGIGTAVAVYPIIKRYGPGRAVGFIGTRVLEAAIITAGVLAILAVYTMRQDLAGTDPTALTTTASALVAVRNWSFLFGPGVMAVCNALCFASVLRQSRLVPRWIPTLGLIGAPVLFISTMVTYFGGWEQISIGAMLMVLPIATWELSVGIYMTFKGFRTPQVSDHGEVVEPVVPVALAQV